MHLLLFTIHKYLQTPAAASLFLLTSGKPDISTSAVFYQKLSRNAVSSNKCDESVRYVFLSVTDYHSWI